MGWRSKFNRATKEPALESAALRTQIEEFYKKHPTATPAVSAEVKRIRDMHAQAVVELQKGVDADLEKLDVEFMKKELEFVTQFVV